MEKDAAAPACDGNEQGASRVAVVIVNFNSGSFLVRSVRALRAQTYSDFATIVVDNASTDDSLALLKNQFPDVEVLQAPGNLGFAGANNFAMRETGDCDWIALLNPDAFPDPDWLSRLVTAAQSHPEYSSFASKVVFDSNPQILDGAGDDYHLSGFAWRRMRHKRAIQANENLEVFAPSATAALYRMSAIDDVGGLDERYFCYYEDVDLGFRLRLLGHRCLFVADAVVRHVGSGITGERSAFVTYHTQRNRIWTYVKNMPNPWVWILLPLHCFYQLLVIGRYAVQGHLFPAFRGTRDALRGMRSCLDDRRSVQASRRVSLSDLTRVLRKGIFDPIFKR